MINGTAACALVRHFDFSRSEAAIAGIQVHIHGDNDHHIFMSIISMHCPVRSCSVSASDHVRHTELALSCGIVSRVPSELLF
jgi:hypothetical protein